MVPLPDAQARGEVIDQLLSAEAAHLSTRDLDRIVALTDGYSFSDLKALCSEAAMGPLREFSAEKLTQLDARHIRPISLRDFTEALHRVKASTNPDTLRLLAAWDAK
jgi:spastin